MEMTWIRTISVTKNHFQKKRLKYLLLTKSLNKEEEEKVPTTMMKVKTEVDT